MSRVALDLGFIQIYWYSICILLGILVAGTIIIRESRKQNINEDFIVNVIFYTIICGIIGARLYYVVFNLDYYLQYPLEILEVWNGGMAIHGGVIAGGLFIYYYARKYKVNFFKLLDISVVGLIIGQAIGRWGNFFNGEAYGGITTLAHLKEMMVPDFIIDGMYIQGVYHQPTFLYESIWCLAGFILLLIVRRFKYIKNGQVTGVYLIWYSIGRFFIEGMRTDSLMLGSLKMAQLVSIVGIVLGIFIIIYCRKGTRFDNLYKTKEEKEILY